MFAFAARFLSGMATPLIDRASAKTARLLRKLALFAVAGVALIVVLIALTVAFDLWIASMRGPIVGALAVAGLYLAVAIAAVGAALLSGRTPTRPPVQAAASAATGARTDTDAQIDAFAAPLLRVLRRLGLRREQLAVLAGTSLAKQVGPLPLLGLAIVGGFFAGRMWGGLRGILSADLIATLAKSGLLAGLFRPNSEAEADNADAT